MRKILLFIGTIVGLVMWSSCSSPPAETGTTTSETAERTGEQIYQKYCQVCHQGSVRQSPKLGDRKAWESRLSKGREKLIESVRVGIPPVMPKKGNCMSCTETELASSVDYMLDALQDETTEETE